MLYINNNPDYISQLANNWYRKLNKFLTLKKQYWVEYMPSRKKKKKKRVYFGTYMDKMKGNVSLSNLSVAEKKICEQYINDFMSKLLDYSTANEFDLKSFHDKYQTEMLNNPTEQKVNAHAMLSDVFMKLYENFTESEPIFEELDDKEDKELYSHVSIAYYFFLKLNIRTCPYCNRNYTFTIHGNVKKTRPEYDHFYAKSNYPLLAVSFYNLVPSCHTCNHIKLDDSLFINPFFHGFKGRFTMTYDGHYEGYKAKINEETKDMSVLGLDQLYPLHDDYVQEIFDKANSYNKHAREALINSFQGAGESPSKVFEFVWGKNMEEARHINRPLSKLTHDILEQVGVIENSNDDSET